MLSPKKLDEKIVDTPTNPQPFQFGRIIHDCTGKSNGPIHQSATINENFS
jgi:hypothetical protein